MKGDTVLLVEDDPALRKLVTTVLRRHGYGVVSVGSADAASAALDDEPTAALVLADLHLPGEVTGAAFVEQLRDRRPELPLVVVTGSSAADAPDGVEVLTKPFDVAGLTATVERLLTTT